MTLPSTPHSEHIPLFKPFVAAHAAENVRAVLDSGYIGEGPKVKEFEAALEHLLDAPVLTVNSGTSAIHLALDLAGINRGDWVVSTPMTCIATNVCVLQRGAHIAWADVDPSTGLIDPADAYHMLRAMDAKAILAVDYGGLPCDYEAIAYYTALGGASAILDAAHSLLTMLTDSTGTYVHNHHHMDYTCYSFQAIKHLTTGDGGGLICPPHKREEARRKRWFGLDRSLGGFRCEQEVKELGYKFHMNDIAAAIGLANIESVEDVVTIARENAAYYHAALADLPITLPPLNPDASWWLYTILVPNRELFIRDMEDRGIQCAKPHSRNDVNPIFRLYHRNLPGVEKFDSRQVAIPVGWWVTPTLRERIATTIHEVLR